MNFYTLPNTLESEFKDLERLVLEFQKNEITPDQFKHSRVPFGVYEQRKCGTYMMRIRTPGGAVTPSQLKKVGELSRQYGSHRIHLTTRQEIQIHDVKIDHIVNVMHELLGVGLSTRGGGGNTIRNITASQDSGINEDEAFDVQPYVTALTNHYVKSGDSWKLPRKLKIAVSSSEHDNVNARIQDLGFIAKVQDGKKGFQVYVGGGMGSKPEFGKELVSFVPAEEILYVGQAIKTLFSKYGNRKNRSRARMRFLWEELGAEKFKQYFSEELAEAKIDKGNILPKLETFEGPSKILIDPLQVESTDFSQWQKRYVQPQKQNGLVSVQLPLVLGDLSSEDAIKLADGLAPFGENVIRLTMGQDIHIRNIPKLYLGNLFFNLQKIKSNAKKPVLLSQMVTCTGASTCKLGICLSRGATPVIQRELENGLKDLDLLSDLKIHISGCSNSCGQHLIGDLGFFGRIKRHNGRAFPAYNLLVGARVNGEEKRFGVKAGWVTSHDLPKAVVEILRSYQQVQKNYISFAEYIDGPGLEITQHICEKFQSVPGFDEDKSYYVDWGAKEPFSVKEIGQGECAAGLTDLIEADLKRIVELEKELKRETGNDRNLLLQLLRTASRALLTVKGIGASSEEDLFKKFIETYIDTEVISKTFLELFTAAKEKNLKRLQEKKDDVLKFGTVARQYYHALDDSLVDASASLQKPKSGVYFEDFRGVKCPLNFAKIKVALHPLERGELLEVLIDDGEPIKNVPPSIKLEGHHIVNQEKIESHWSLVIKKN